MTNCIGRPTSISSFAQVVCEPPKMTFSQYLKSSHLLNTNVKTTAHLTLESLFIYFDQNDEIKARQDTKC